MTTKFFTKSLLASVLLAASSLALAQGNNTPAVDRAQEAISARIQQGMASGHITPSEARQLLQRDRDISQRESNYKSNGSATQQERQQLRSDLDGLAAEVERMMSNRDTVQPPGNANNANTRGIDNRQVDIGERIDEGVRSGDLSERDARRLQRRARDIARHEASYKRDGVVTPQERRQLRNELTRLNNDLDRMMGEDRPYQR